VASFPAERDGKLDRSHCDAEGERRARQPAPAGLDAQYRVVTSLWDIGAAPPADVAAGEEAQPVFLVKDDAARTYALCGESGREGAVVARCETRYVVEDHAAAAPCGDVPAEVLGDAEGETVRQTFVALEAGVLADTVSESVRKWLADKVPGELLTASIEPFLSGQAGAEATAPGSTWRRLARVVVEVHTVPLTRLTLGYRDPGDAGGVAPFDVWLCGTRQELHFGALPRMWTRKAFVWLAASAAAGVPVGFAVIKLLQSAL
jgi:hypothetical protein